MKIRKQLIYLILLPISKLWEGLYRLRRFLFDIGFLKHQSYKVPIVSIGNLTLGGTGKTPLTLWLAKHLNESNKNVMILTRGYKGKLENSSGIIRAGEKIENNPIEYGDEALVLCRGLKNGSVVVGSKRSQNLDYYFLSEQPDVVLLDDGHQHLKIDRNLNIVLFDSTLPLESYSAPPLGYLREGMTALKAADIVVFGRADLVDNDRMSELQSLVRSHCGKTTPFSSFYYSPSSVKNLNFEYEMEPSSLEGKKVVCVSGIASPASFYELIKKEGVDIVETFEFHDHHYYTAEELNQIVNIAKEKEAIVLTTEKDVVKLRRVIDSDIVFYVEIQIKFLSGEQELKRLVDHVLF